MSESDRTFKDLGFDYADAAHPHLVQKLGREPSLEELGDFYYAANATMVGVLYSVYYKAKGQEKANEWLAKILIGIPTMIRSKGVPLLLSLTASVAPLDTPESAGESTTPLIGKPPGPCTCAPVDGLCQPCLERMTKGMKLVIGGILNYLQSTIEVLSGMGKRCGACDLKCFDAALASAIREEVSHGEARNPHLSEQLVMMMYQMAGQFGVRELPLTEKAWAWLKAQKG